MDSTKNYVGILMLFQNKNSPKAISRLRLVLFIQEQSGVLTRLALLTLLALLFASRADAQVPSEPRFESVSAGAFQTVAVDGNGAPWAWGAPGGTQAIFSLVPKRELMAAGAGSIPGSVATLTQQADCLFDKAAQQLPNQFAPASATSIGTRLGRFRYVAQTQTYLGLAFEARAFFCLSAAEPVILGNLGDAGPWFTASGCE